MIIYPNKSFVTRDGEPNTNFADEEYKDKVLVIDDNSDLAQSILSGAPYDIRIVSGKVVDVFLIPENVVTEH